jgi:hypothetical protein
MAIDCDASCYGSTNARECRCRIFIELIDWPLLRDLKATPAEYKAGLDLCIVRRLALEARERHLCEAHASRRGPFRLIWMKPGAIEAYFIPYHRTSSSL